MEKQVIFRDRQELTSGDLNNIETFAQGSLDDIVKDAVTATARWAGFSVTKSGTAQVTVTPGRIYASGGGVYSADVASVFDLLGSLPLTNKKWVAVVAWGSVVETDAQPRDFLVDAATGETQPQAVAMQRLRKANIATVVGVEAPQPVQPAITVGNVVLAWVLLNTTDVESVTMVLTNRVPNAESLGMRVDALESWRNLIGPRVDSLASDVARIAREASGAIGQRDLTPLAMDIARLKEFAGLEDSYSDYGSDGFNDTDESLTTDVNYRARIEDGLTFADDAANAVAMQLFNPLNPDVKQVSGMILPAHNEEQRFAVGPFYEQKSISQYQFQTHELTQKSVSKTRVRYGVTKVMRRPSFKWYVKHGASYDATQQTFAIAGETWEVLNTKTNGKLPKKVQLRQFWVDTYEEPYWDRILTDHTIQGQQLGQTFLNPQDGWLTSVGLYFTQKAATGDVHLLLTEVVNGMPDPQAVLAKVTVAVADLATSSTGAVQTKVAIPPVFLEAGTRYAIMLITGGNHYVGMALGSAYANGTFFHSVDGAYMQGTDDRDMMFALHFAKFTKSRYVIDLAAMSLSGGIADVDFNFAGVVPGSCELAFEVQVAGVWKPIANVIAGNTVLHGLPPLLPARAIFTGTYDVQPSMHLTGSLLSFSRPATTFKHISTIYTLAAPTQSFKVSALIEHYKEVNHDLTCTLQANGAGGEISPASYVDVDMGPSDGGLDADHRIIKRTWTWTATEITASMASVRITLNGATSSARDPYVVSERTHLAF